MRQITINLPDELAEELEARVESGDYSDVHEAVVSRLTEAWRVDAAGPELDHPGFLEFVEKVIYPEADAVDRDPSLLVTPEELDQRIAHRRAAAAQRRATA